MVPAYPRKALQELTPRSTPHPPPHPPELLPGCHLPLGSVSADEAESPGLVAAQMAL